MTQSIRPKTRIIDGPSVRYAESEPRDHHALLFSPWSLSVSVLQISRASVSRRLS
jgi:hypothetical protein